MVTFGSWTLAAQTSGVTFNKHFEFHLPLSCMQSVLATWSPELDLQPGWGGGGGLGSLASLCLIISISARGDQVARHSCRWFASVLDRAIYSVSAESLPTIPPVRREGTMESREVRLEVPQGHHPVWQRGWPTSFAIPFRLLSVTSMSGVRVPPKEGNRKIHLRGCRLSVSHIYV